MGKKVTMQMIADELGISKALVSKSLSNQAGVSEETKERIRLAAMRLGYPFNSTLVSVPSSRTGIIALLIPGQDLGDLEYWGEILFAVEKELSKKSFSMIVSAIDNSVPSSRGMPSCIIERKVDGVIIAESGQILSTYIAAVLAAGIPTVMIDPSSIKFKIDYVLADNYYGGYEVARYLLDKGHRKVGFVGDIDYALSFSERYRGFVDAIRDYRIEQKDINIEEFHITSGRGDSYIPLSGAHLEKILRMDNRPTALMCANDPVAFSTLEIIESLGLSCPDDVSIIGFDNVNKCQCLVPALTSVDACKSMLGTRAVQLLIRRMNEPDLRPEYVTLSTQIVERSSVSSIIK